MTEVESFDTQMRFADSEIGLTSKTDTSGRFGTQSD